MVGNSTKHPYAIIVTATEAVYEVLAQYLEGLKEDIHPRGTIYTRGSFTLTEGRLRGRELEIVLVNGGDTGIAMETERAIGHYEPSVAVFVGTAIGLGKTRSGDVVATKQVHAYGAGKAGDRFLTRPQSHYPSFLLGNRIHQEVIKARMETEHAPWLRRLASSPLYTPIVHFDRIVSGAKELSVSAATKPGTTGAELLAYLDEHYNGAIAIEQGSYGFFESIHANNAKIESAVVLGITHTLTADPSQIASERLESIAAEHATAFTFEVLEQWMLQQVKGYDLDWPALQSHTMGGDQADEITKPYSSSEVQQEQQTETSNNYRDSYLRNFIVSRQGDKQRSRADLILEQIYVEPDLTNARRIRSLGRLQSNLPRTKIIAQDPRESYPEDKKLLTFDRIRDTVLQYNKPTHLVITGEAGLGKTTLLTIVGIHCARLALEDSRYPLPIFIALADYAAHIQTQSHKEETQSRLEEYLVNRLGNTSNEDVKDALHKGSYLLLMDGLDEINNPNLRASIVNVINHISANSPCNIIVTSRGASYDGQFTWPVHDLVPFSEPQIIRYIKKSLEESLPRQELLVALENGNDRQKLPLLRLLSTPLALAMMVNTIETASKGASNLSIPDGRVSLYQRYIEQSMQRLDKLWQSGIDSQRILTSIAYGLHISGKYYATKQEISKYIANALPGRPSANYEDLLDDIDKETGLLQPRASNFYTFQHLVLQEFFTAKYLAERAYILGEEETNQEFLLTHSTDPWWHEVTTIYYALTANETLLKKLFETDNNVDDVAFIIRAQLVADCLRSASVTDASLEKQVYEQLKQRYYDDASCSAFKECLFEAVKRLGGDLFLRFLQEIYRREEEESRLEVIQALSRFEGDKAEVAAILESWYNSSRNIYERREIIATLIQIEKTMPSPSLLLSSFSKDSEYADQIVEQLIDAQEQKQNDSYLDALFDLTKSYGISAEIQNIILTRLGSTELSSMQLRFKEQLQEAIASQHVPLIITLLKTIHFPLDMTLHTTVLSLIRPYAKMTIPLLLACIEFLGNQAIYTHQQELDASLLFILLYDVIAVDNHDLALTNYYHGNDRENVHLAIVTILIQLNSPIAFEHIQDYLHEIDAPLSSEQFISLTSRYGTTECLRYLNRELESPYNQEISSEREALLLALYEVDKRLLGLQISSAKIVSEQCYQQLFSYFQKVDLNTTAESVIEALLFILFYHSDGLSQSIAEIYKLARWHGRLGDILAANLLDYKKFKFNAIEKSEHTNEFITYYIDNRPSSWLTYQLRIEYCAGNREDRRSILLRALRELDPEGRFRALDIAESIFDSDSNELVEALHALLKVTDDMVVEKTIKVLGKLGGSESEEILQSFLHKSSFENSAFAALFQLRRRLF